MKTTDLEDNAPYFEPEDKVFANYEQVLKIVEHQQWKVFIWQDSKMEILVDMQTAYLLKKVHDALSKEAQEKMEKMLMAGPSNFDKVVKLSWGAIK